MHVHGHKRTFLTQSNPQEPTLAQTQRKLALSALRTFTLRKCCAVREWQVWGSRSAAPVQLMDGGFGPKVSNLYVFLEGLSVLPPELMIAHDCRRYVLRS